jgi:hypothetical protein
VAERMNPEMRRAQMQRRLTQTKNLLEQAREAQATGALDRAVSEVIGAIEFLVDVLDDELTP